MIRQNFIIPVILLFFILPANAQVKKQEQGLKREVTLYNPYKPSLPDAKKRSFLPEMNDTVKVRPEFRYEISSKPFLPVYAVTPIKAVSLLPDPLPKLYKSYINIGLGNYITPLAEISITNERSKKGAIGFYARHFSSNGNIALQDNKKVFAGYMDNDASLFGKKFFSKSVFESSLDLAEKTRYAYGFDTRIADYFPVKKNIRLNYTNIGAKAALSSLNLDSASFSYKFDIAYNYFYNTKTLYQNSFRISGMMSKLIGGLYVGSGISYDYDKVPNLLLPDPKYIASISPFIKKRNEQWNFTVGFQAVLERNLDSSAVFHIYPDLNIGFNVVPSYLNFFAGLSGKLEKNDPLKIIGENPFLVPDGTLFKLPNTDHSLIFYTGLKGNSGIGGTYLVSASYSLINDMLLYSNIVFPTGVPKPEVGNHFIPLSDDAELLNIHGEIRGLIGDKLTYNGSADWYRYTLSENRYAWNRPDWESTISLKYNLLDKIIAGVEVTGIGKRKLYVKEMDIINLPFFYYTDAPVHVNLNLSAEYRYSKIISVWAKFNNISYNKYYEWAFYPTKRFICMLGFTYSL
jgi:hypothetical protein